MWKDIKRLIREHRILAALCATLLLLTAACMALRSRQAYAGPDFITALQSGVLTPDQVASVDILKFEIPGFWPFSEADYDTKARKRLGASETAFLLKCLNAKSVPRQWHNHPTTAYMGIFRIDLQKGDHYYVIYDLEFCEGSYFVGLDSNLANCPNPNYAVDMENFFLQSFLQAHDPWYHSMDEPFEVRRNRPDTSP